MLLLPDAEVAVQGVFFFLYTLFYSISARHCHAFVGVRSCCPDLHFTLSAVLSLQKLGLGDLMVWILRSKVLSDSIDIWE